MPTLEFKGKQHIYAHHRTVPYRPLIPDSTRSLNSTGADDNLIIHGDNLHALKALLPRYAGRVKCIYIDPPYNTGNKDWSYNDNVNSPLMKEWLKHNSPVDGEDLERHDKWLCMMWPRLHLLKELLSDDGVIFISIDDNEQHHLRMLIDEIFGGRNFITNFVWQKNTHQPMTLSIFLIIMTLSFVMPKIDGTLPQVQGGIEIYSHALRNRINGSGTMTKTAKGLGGPTI